MMSAKRLRALVRHDSAPTIEPTSQHDELQDLSQRPAEVDLQPPKRRPPKMSAKRLRAQVEQSGHPIESAAGKSEPVTEKRPPSKVPAKQLRAQASGSGHSSASARLASQLLVQPIAHSSAEGQSERPNKWPRGSRERGWNLESARSVRSSVANEKRFDLADPVASALLEPLYEGSSTARAQRQALAVTMRGGASSSTQAVARLGNYGSAPQNSERDLHRLTRREAKDVRPKISHILLTIRDFSSKGQSAMKKKKGKRARMPKTEEQTKQLRWPVRGPQELRRVVGLSDDTEPARAKL